MTRTARAAYPRAVIKDRSESRSGLDPSIRKSGAGRHNWGGLADELHLETAAIDDQGLEERETQAPPVSTSTIDSRVSRSVSPQRQPENTRILTDEEVEKARNFRKNAFKTNEIDLTAIARTSSAVSAPQSPQSPIVVRRPGQDNKQIPIQSV